jgi:hypothetical protein
MPNSLMLCRILTLRLRVLRVGKDLVDEKPCIWVLLELYGG